MKLLPILIIEDNKRRLIHVNVYQIVTVYKQGDSYYMTVSDAGTPFRITKSSYDLIIGYGIKGEGIIAEEITIAERMDR